MPPTDYDFTKTLQATSFNDSGITVDKAQPVLLRGNDYTGVDGFESGSSQLGWESNNFSIDNNSEIYLNNSLKSTTSNQSFSRQVSFTESITSDGKRIVGSIKIDNQTGNVNDKVSLNLDGVADAAGVTFTGDGNIQDVQGNNVSTWSAGTVYDIEIVVDFTNNEYDIVIDEVTQASNVAFLNNVSEISLIEIVNDTSNSGATVNAFFDRLTYTSPVEDSVNAGGFIGYDSSTVTDAQDVAFYDQNDNLLDYEIENPGDLGSSSAEVTAWVYRSFTRDDSDQVKFAYGNNSANTDRQNVTGTWDNTGQNALMVQHLQDDPLTATDSTANNNDGTVSGATATTGEFDGAASFDGTDDNISIGDIVGVGDYTFISYQKINSSTQGTPQNILSDASSATTPGLETSYRYQNNSLLLKLGDGTNEVITSGSTELADDTFHHSVGRIDDSLKEISVFVDSTKEGTNSNANLGNYDGGVAEKIGADNSERNFLTGTIDEFRIYNDLKDNVWIQADYDASPKAGQVFYTQDAAQSTVTATEATANKYSASYSSVTPNVIVSKIATGTKYSANYSTLQADSISNATSTANKYSGTYSSKTAPTSFSATIQATKYSATYSSQTAATTSVEVVPATKYSATYTANTAETALPITANATKYSATYSSQTATTIQILSAAADKYSASYNSETAGTVSIKTAPVTKYSANYSTRQASTTFDATTNATKYSASYTAETATTLVKQMAEADKYNLTYSSKTATAKILVSGPDVTYPLFVNEESMRKRIKDQ